MNGNRSNDWNIECNTGQNIHTLFSNSHKELNRIQFVRDDNSNILFGTEKHFIDTIWLKKVLSLSDTRD